MPLDKTYDPAAVEARRYADWEAQGAFDSGRRPGADPYTIVIPPPNVTGSLHIGHALNNTLQDVLVRWQRMRGRDALWQPGTDHAGIATQMVVERELAKQGITLDRGHGPPPGGGRTIGREAFVERVWQQKEQSGGTIRRQLGRLGASADWRRERFTMDDGLSRAVIRVFVQLYRDGLIYRDQRLVNWDPGLHTAISDLEVQPREVDGQLWYIRYPVEGGEGRFLTVATTRPETMLGDTGVAVHPDDGRYADLVGRHCLLPLVGRRLPVVADPHADPEQGSGAVKLTPSHDFNDFEVGRRHGLEMINIFDADARINASAPEAYRGLDRFTARDRVVADLEQAGCLDRVEAHRHVVPYGDRSGVVIEPWLTEQWFLDAATLAKPAIAAVEDGRTRFVPETWTATYYEWMRNIQPWCISRQLWWGHQIPAWYGPDGAVFVEETEAAARAAAVARYREAGAAAELDAVRSGGGLTRDPDVLDTWFSSQLWPFSTLGWPEDTPELRRHYPTDVLVTSFDIIFFWVARMIMMGLHVMDEVPFRTVYIHALVRDSQGRKMSKSQGNVLDPLELIDRYGADALRFTLIAMAAQGRDIKLSTSRVEGYRNFITKLWNAARLCEMNGCLPAAGFDPAAPRSALNRWIIGAAVEAGGAVARALDAYKFDQAAHAVYRFAWHTFCDWYLELAKPALQGADSAERSETRATAGWVLGRILLLLHPFAPFVTEELGQRLMPDAGPLITAAWPEDDPALIDADAAAELDWLVRLVTEIRSVRAEMNVPAGAAVPMILNDASAKTRGRVKRHAEGITRLARTGGIETDGAVPPGAVQTVVDEATVVLPLAGVIDIGRERTRLEKEIARLSGDIAQFDRRLANENFVARAPAEVVAEQRDRRAGAKAARSRLAAALEQLRTA